MQATAKIPDEAFKRLVAELKLLSGASGCQVAFSFTKISYQTNLKLTSVS